jgi:hypothetical protein
MFIWTQFYAVWFSPSNRYPLSRQAESVQLKELANIDFNHTLAGSDRYTPDHDLTLLAA